MVFYSDQRYPQLLEGERLRALFERSLAAAPGVDLAFYELGSVVGKLRAGTVRSGDLYNAESWENKIVHVAIKGRDLNPNLHARLPAPLEADRTYTLATIDFFADALMESDIGDGEVVSEHGFLRDRLIEHTREHGFG